MGPIIVSEQKILRADNMTVLKNNLNPKEQYFLPAVNNIAQHGSRNSLKHLETLSLIGFILGPKTYEARVPV